MNVSSSGSGEVQLVEVTKRGLKPQRPQQTQSGSQEEYVITDDVPKDIESPPLKSSVKALHRRVLSEPVLLDPQSPRPSTDVDDIAKIMKGYKEEKTHFQSLYDQGQQIAEAEGLLDVPKYLPKKDVKNYTSDRVRTHLQDMKAKVEDTTKAATTVEETEAKAEAAVIAKEAAALKLMADFNDFEAGREKLMEAAKSGYMKPEEIHQKAHELATLLARAFQMANEDGWTQVTIDATNSAGHAYATPSITAFFYTQLPNLARVFVTTGLELNRFLNPCSSEAMHLAKSIVNICYLPFQLGMAIMASKFNAMKQPKYVREMARVGPPYIPAVTSDTLMGENRKPAKLRPMKLVKSDYQVHVEARNMIEQWNRDGITGAIKKQSAKVKKLNQHMARIANKFADALPKDATQLSDEEKQVLKLRKEVIEELGPEPPAFKKGTIGWDKREEERANWWAKANPEKVQAQIDIILTCTEGRASLDAGARQKTSDLLTSLRLRTELVGYLNRAKAELDDRSRGKCEMPPDLLATMGKLVQELVLAESYLELQVAKNGGDVRAVRGSLYMLSIVPSMVSTAWWFYEKGASYVREWMRSSEPGNAVPAMNSTMPMPQPQPSWLPQPMNGTETCKELPSTASRAIGLGSELTQLVLGVTQLLYYYLSYGDAVAEDYRNKLDTMFKIAVLSGYGNILDDKTKDIDPQFIDSMVKGPIKTRLKFFQDILEFDSRVYVQAMMVDLVDPKETDDAKALNVVVKVVKEGKNEKIVDVRNDDDPKAELADGERRVPCTFLSLRSEFREQQPDDRLDFLKMVANALDVKNTDPIDHIYKQYTANEVNVQRCKDGKIDELLTAETLPGTTREMLKGSLLYAMENRFPDAGDEKQQKRLEEVEVQAWREQDALLSEKAGLRDRYSDPDAAFQWEQKMGQQFANICAGSGGFLATRGFGMLIVEALRIHGRMTESEIEQFAANCLKGGLDLFSVVASLTMIGLGYGYHKYIVTKALQRQAVADFPPISNSSPGGIGLWDFFAWVSADWARSEVTDFTTLAAAPIKAADLPAPGSKLPYENKSPFLKNLWQQMKAVDAFSFRQAWENFNAAHGGLDLSKDEDLLKAIKKDIEDLGPKMKPAPVGEVKNADKSKADKSKADKSKAEKIDILDSEDEMAESEIVSEISIEMPPVDTKVSAVDANGELDELDVLTKDLERVFAPSSKVAQKHKPSRPRKATVDILPRDDGSRKLGAGISSSPNEEGLQQIKKGSVEIAKAYVLPKQGHAEEIYHEVHEHDSGIHATNMLQMFLSNNNYRSLVTETERGKRDLVQLYRDKVMRDVGPWTPLASTSARQSATVERQFEGVPPQLRGHKAIAVTYAYNHNGELTHHSVMLAPHGDDGEFKIFDSRFGKPIKLSRLTHRADDALELFMLQIANNAPNKHEVKFEIFYAPTDNLLNTDYNSSVFKFLAPGDGPLIDVSEDALQQFVEEEARKANTDPWSYIEAVYASLQAEDTRVLWLVQADPYQQLHLVEKNEAVRARLSRAYKLLGNKPSQQLF